MPSHTDRASWPQAPQTFDTLQPGLELSGKRTTPTAMVLRFWSVIDARATLRRSHVLTLDATGGAEMHFSPNGTALMLWSDKPGIDLCVLHFLAPEAREERNTKA